MPKATNNVTRKTNRQVVAGKTASASAASATTATVEDVALRAFLIYEAEGRPDGRHVEHWLQAESELRI